MPPLHYRDSSISDKAHIGTHGMGPGIQARSSPAQAKAQQDQVPAHSAALSNTAPAH